MPAPVFNAPPSAAERAFAALSSRQRDQLLRGVFNILEYDEAGQPGNEWSADTTQALGSLFAEFGIVFTTPGTVIGHID